MKDNKEVNFKCPSCGEMLSVETKEDEGSEHSSNPMEKKMHAGNMPMDQLKNKINPTPVPSSPSLPNMNSY